MEMSICARYSRTELASAPLRYPHAGANWRATRGRQGALQASLPVGLRRRSLGCGCDVCV